MQNLRVLVWQFYKPFLYHHLFFTCFSVFLILGKTAAFILALAAKIVSYGGMIFYQHFFNKQHYFYYRNAGRPIRQMYLFTLIPDFFIFLAFSIIIITLKQYGIC